MGVCNDESTYLLFQRCEKIIDDVNQGKALITYQDKCNNIVSQYSDIFNSNIKDICCQSLAYLNKVYNEVKDASLDTAGFKYLYYWLYKYKLKWGKKSSDIKNFYDELINIYKINVMSYTVEKDYQSVTVDEFENLKSSYDMHNSFIFIKEKCKPNENENYCTKIKEIMDKYKEQNIIEH
ncbi:variable surface protein, partial [Plasmodium gonderi]